VSSEGQRLQQINDLLAQRGVSVRPVLDAVVASGGAGSAAWGVSATSQRLELLTPVKHEALVAVAPDSQLPTNLPAKGFLRYTLDGSKVAVALMSVETLDARETVDELVPPGATRSAWYAAMELLPTGGAVLNRFRYLTEQRWAISNTYVARDAAAQADFVRQTTALLEHLDIPATQAALWPAIAEAAGPGPVLIRTESDASGPLPRISFLYSAPEWDRAIDLVKIVAPDRATAIASTFGLLSTTLKVERLRGIEVVLGEGGADVIPWLSKFGG
jgi:hypothetical protein